MWAAAEGHAPVVQALIEAGADFKARVPSGLTPLLFAVREGRTDVVRVLLKAGADVNETIPVEGRRPGIRRRRAGSRNHARCCWRSGTPISSWRRCSSMPARIRTRTCPGYTVLHAITAVRKPGVGDNDPPPDGSGTMTSLDLVKKLVAKGADSNARMTKKVNLNNTRLQRLGATPFMLAALTADAELMRTLAALGADPLLTNAENSTPLMAAAGLGDAFAGRGRRDGERSASKRCRSRSIWATTSMPSTRTAKPRCTAPPTRTCPRS